MFRDSLTSLLRPLGIPLMAEGLVMLVCVVPAVHFADGTASKMLLCGLFVMSLGFAVTYYLQRLRQTRVDRRVPYLIVATLWLVLPLFGTLPFVVTGVTHSFSDAFFESMSGLTTTGATIFTDVEHLPASILLWRSILQWVGGFGIVLLVLAVIPTLGINKYSLYTAEASGADNVGTTSGKVTVTIRRTLTVYVTLTLIFIALLISNDMEPWDAVNLTFTNISSGGFSIHNDSIASLQSRQQYILAAAMFFSGINFSLLYQLFSFKFKQLRNRLEQFAFYILLLLMSVTFVVFILHYHTFYDWETALRLGIVQTTSVVTTTGSVVADTTLWWTPVVFLFVVLSLCGGMAGSTTGGIKAMRVIILVRNVRNVLRNRLHPHIVNPMRLNGRPVASSMVNNVMVIFMTYFVIAFLATLLLMLSGIDATQSVGAAVACLSGYGPGLGASGGFGSYAAFTTEGKWICVVLMLLGRLECLTLLVLLFPRFWRS